MQVATADSHDELAAIVTEQAPGAYELTRITACAGQDYHTVWLDPQTATVWHAWTEPGSDTWRLEKESAGEAERWITEVLALVLDNLGDPELAYQSARPGEEEDDLAALEELEEVQLAALRARTQDPVEVDQMIRVRMDSLRAELARLGSLRSRNLAEAFGRERGAAAEVARRLGISHQSARTVLAAGDEYADRVRQAAARARQSR